MRMVPSPAVTCSARSLKKNSNSEKRFLRSRVTKFALVTVSSLQKRLRHPCRHGQHGRPSRGSSPLSKLRSELLMASMEDGRPPPSLRHLLSFADRSRLYLFHINPVRRIRTCVAGRAIADLGAVVASLLQTFQREIRQRLSADEVSNLFN